MAYPNGTLSESMVSPLSPTPASARMNKVGAWIIQKCAPAYANIQRGLTRLEKLYSIPVTTTLVEPETSAEFARNLELSAAKLRRVFLFLEEKQVASLEEVLLTMRFTNWTWDKLLDDPNIDQVILSTLSPIVAAADVLETLMHIINKKEDLIADCQRVVDDTPTDTRVLINLAATKIFRMERFFQQLQLYIITRRLDMRAVGPQLAADLKQIKALREKDLLTEDEYLDRRLIIMDAAIANRDRNAAVLSNSPAAGGDAAVPRKTSRGKGGSVRFASSPIEGMEAPPSYEEATSPRNSPAGSHLAPTANASGSRISPTASGGSARGSPGGSQLAVSLPKSAMKNSTASSSSPNTAQRQSVMEMAANWQQAPARTGSPLSPSAQRSPSPNRRAPSPNRDGVPVVLAVQVSPRGGAVVGPPVTSTGNRLDSAYVNQEAPPPYFEAVRYAPNPGIASPVTSPKPVVDRQSLVASTSRRREEVEAEYEAEIARTRAKLEAQKAREELAKRQAEVAQIEAESQRRSVWLDSAQQQVVQLSQRAGVPLSPRSAAAPPPPAYTPMSEEDEFKQVALRKYEEQQLENARLLEAIKEKKRLEEERKARGEPEPAPPQPVASPKPVEDVLSPRTKKEKEEAKKKEKEEKERLKREEKEREKKEKEDRRERRKSLSAAERERREKEDEIRAEREKRLRKEREEKELKEKERKEKKEEKTSPKGEEVKSPKGDKKAKEEEEKKKKEDEKRAKEEEKKAKEEEKRKAKEEKKKAEEEKEKKKEKKDKK